MEAITCPVCGETHMPVSINGSRPTYGCPVVPPGAVFRVPEGDVVYGQQIQVAPPLAT